jgi:hypothetical protein
LADYGTRIRPGREVGKENVLEAKAEIRKAESRNKRRRRTKGR